MNGAQSNSVRRFLVAGTVWTAAGRVIAMLGNLALSIILARALSPTDYGRFYVAMSSVIIFAVVAALGMDQAVIRAVAMPTGSGVGAAHRIVRHCLLWVCVGTVGVGLMVVAAATRYSLDDVFGTSTLVGLVVAWAIVGTFQMQLTESFRALGRIDLTNVFGGIRSSGTFSAVIPCGLMFLLWSLGELNLRTAVIVMLFTVCALSATAFITIERMIRPATGGRAGAEVDRLTRKGMLGLGIPLWLAAVVTVLHSQGLLWMATLIESPSNVARLAAAQRIVLVMIAPTVIVNAVIPPLLATLWEKSELQRFQKITQVVAAIATVPALAIFIVLAVAGPRTLEFLFGTFYGGAYFQMLVLCFAQVVNIATGSWQIVLAMTGYGKALFWLTLLGFIVFIVLALTSEWLPALGVAIAWAVGTIVLNLAGLIVSRRLTGVHSYAWLRLRDLKDVSRIFFKN